MGCTECKSKGGCDDRKGTMYEQIERALSRLYPTRRWGEPDDRERLGQGVCDHESQTLAQTLARELRAQAVFVPGGDEEFCDYIYVLCVGRAPGLVELRARGRVPDTIADEITNDQPIAEQYLRVCLSHMTRMAGVQQTLLELSPTPDGWLFTESPRPGVYDAPLLKRFQALVAALVDFDITHLDFGEISAPPAGFDAGGYGALYGGAPHTANFLFYPQPSNTRVTTFVDKSGTA